MLDSPTQRFLMARHPGYADLSADERTAIGDFSILWPLLEGSILGPQSRPADLLQIPVTLNEQGDLGPDTFAQEIAHFKSRYFRENVFTPEFFHLHAERSGADVKSRIEAFLSSDSAYPYVEAVQGLLLVVYRLRNNLFHGVKAMYGIKGQLDNFLHANAVLVRVLTLHPSRY